MDARKLAALAKKNAAREYKKKEKQRQKYDDTLRPESDGDQESQKLFSEMKKREDRTY